MVNLVLIHYNCKLVHLIFYQGNLRIGDDQETSVTKLELRLIELINFVNY